MKVSFVVVPILDANSSLAEIRTDMLVLGKFRNLELSVLQSFDDRTQGIASKVLNETDFIGDENQDVVLVLPSGGYQRRVLFAGLGRTQDYGCKTVAHVAQRAVVQAIEHGCTRVAMPFPPNRSTALSLKMQAHYIREAVEAVVREEKRDGEIVIEFVCSRMGGGARELQKGIAMPYAGLCCCKKKVGGGQCQGQASVG